MERVSIRAGPAKYTGPCGDLCVESVGPGGPGPLWDPQPPRMFVAQQFFSSIMELCDQATSQTPSQCHPEASSSLFSSCLGVAQADSQLCTDLRGPQRATCMDARDVRTI